jgi:hypothetical protein
MDYGVIKQIINNKLNKYKTLQIKIKQNQQ